MTLIESAGRSTRAAAALVMLACGGDGDDGPAGNTGSIQVVVTPSTLTVPQGSTGTVTVTLTRSGGFTGPVTMAVSLPAGITATVTPTQLTGTTTTATVVITVTASVAPGTYTATITATAQGVAQASTTYALTVTGAPDYALSATPGAVTIAAGASNSVTINIERTNFTGGVTLELVNPPAGITGVLSPTPSTTNASSLAVTVGATVAPGNYPLTIKGTTAGITDRIVLLQLTVIAAPTAGSDVEYLFCDASLAPVFFAYQDGTSAWQAVASSTSGGAVRFAFNLTSGRAGVMAVFRSSVDAPVAARRTGSALSGKRFTPGTALRQRHPVARRSSRSRSAAIIDVYLTAVLYGSASELAQDGALTCAGTLPTKTVTGTVAGVPGGQYGIISLGSVTEVFEGGGVSTNPVTFRGVQGGLVDFAGTRLTPGTAPSRGVLFRDLNIPDGGSLPAPIDFNGPASFVPATATVNVTGAPGDNLEVYTTVVTATSEPLFWNELASSQTTTRPWAGLNAANLRAGEFHSLIVFASPVGGSGDFRVALKYPGQVANETIALGPIVGLPTVSPVTGGAYPRYRFQGSLPSAYNRGVAIALDPEDAGNSFYALASTTYLTAAGSAQAYDLTMPNVSALPGFPGAARLTSGTNFVTLDAFGFTGPGIFDVRPALGGEFKASDRVSTIVVP